MLAFSNRGGRGGGGGGKGVLTFILEGIIPNIRVVIPNLGHYISLGAL